MANNESSKVKVDTLPTNNRRRSSRIANITTSQLVYLLQNYNFNYINDNLYYCFKFSLSLN